MDREAATRDRREHDQDGQRKAESHAERLQQEDPGRHARGREGLLRPDPQGEQAADERADAEGRGQGGPRRRAAEVALGDDRAEHPVGREREVADPEEDDRRPDPRLATELVPALAQVGEEGLRLDGLRALRQPQRDQEQRPECKGRSIDQKRRPRTAGRDDDAADGRADDSRRVPRSPSSAFACWSRPGLIVAGISPVEAGR